ncbi:MAG: type I restriction enzyme HsdR N-terminal domain-containing protein [Bacteroidales bacterium]
MQALNLPYYEFRMENRDGKTMIFDEIRRKFLVCTPEEWVRQNLIKYFIQEKKIPAGMIALEKEIRVHGIQRRYDAMVHTKNGLPLMLVECKAPGITIKQEVFQQIAEYNIAFAVPYLFVSNGLRHYVCHINPENREINFLKELPAYEKL